jgi:polyisoprenoid-binding protein YceI
MKKTILSFSFLVMAAIVTAQPLSTSSAVVTFDATTPKDALPKAENKTVVASLDKTTGAVEFEATVSNFAFTNPTIQSHFNSDKWMNSTVFPNFTFSGKITKLDKVKFNKNGVYDVNVAGNLTIKGVSKPLNVKAKVTVKGTSVSALSSFTIKLSDYGITGQAIDAGKVANDTKVTVFTSF